ncbi:hypothetical protein C8R46DRAFT_1294330 [Mycena filopes]|nr:hypothetical protein C8R46DRAFT_1294330 [Mycena filopes]
MMEETKSFVLQLAVGAKSTNKQAFGMHIACGVSFEGTSRALDEMPHVYMGGYAIENDPVAKDIAFAPREGKKSLSQTQLEVEQRSAKNWQWPFRNSVSTQFFLQSSWSCRGGVRFPVYTEQNALFVFAASTRCGARGGSKREGWESRNDVHMPTSRRLLLPTVIPHAQPLQLAQNAISRTANVGERQSGLWQSNSQHVVR